MRTSQSKLALIQSWWETNPNCPQYLY